MAKKKTPVAAKPKTRSSSASPTVLGLDLRPALGRGAGAGGEAGRERGPRGEAVLVGAQAAGRLRQLLPELPSWLVERALRKRGEPQLMARPEGPLWLLIPNTRNGSKSHAGLLDASAYGAARDITGLMLVGAFPDYQLSELRLRFVEADPDEIRGALVGVELGLYRFKNVRAAKPATLRVVVEGADEADVAAAGRVGSAVNLARHLVNSPASELNPATFAAAVSELFAGSKTTSVEVWEGDRLTQEGLGLLAAVGQGAVETARLVHIRYRPRGKARYRQPLAFVGKGVTFDTGGLDIKDASSMRLMKKDMGGAASVVGLAHWVEQSAVDVACDFYLALAENSVSDRAFHPGDVITSRAGLTVEIDNTDAEGRLVMADAIDVAVKAEGKDAPLALIDLSTLTGAMRVALGTRIAGYFATHDGLAEAVARAGQVAGEPTWRMPLFQDYWASLKSTVADFANSSTSRFGGAITAALFLQRFVGSVPWVHFDIYAWTDGAIGGCAEAGGSGQTVQLLAGLLEALPADFFD